MLIRHTIAAAVAAFGLTACGPSIGANQVPWDLSCQEDEVIAFVQEGEPPYHLGCVHPDDLGS